MDDQILKRAGLIINPRSGKSSGKGLRLAEMLRGKADVSIRILDHFEQLPVFLQELASDGITDLFISSGDGTIQAIQTELAERRRFNSFPRLSLLPHGTTNMTSADLGFRHHDLNAQAEYINNLQASNIRQRPSLRVVNPSDGKPRHGMFLGTGAASGATRFGQRAFNDHGVKGNWATFATLASAAARIMFTTPNPTDESRFDRPFPIRITSNGRVICDGTQLMTLSTTLEKLILGMKPFWGGKSGSIRTSILPYPVPSIPRWLLPVMYGGENRKVPPGALSFSSESLEITSPTSYVIDGEFFEGPEGTALRVETGPVFTYLCG
jgi:diacylglycerol kinase (ATP)